MHCHRGTASELRPSTAQYAASASDIAKLLLVVSVSVVVVEDSAVVLIEVSVTPVVELLPGDVDALLFFAVNIMIVRIDTQRIVRTIQTVLCFAHENLSEMRKVNPGCESGADAYDGLQPCVRTATKELFIGRD